MKKRTKEIRCQKVQNNNKFKGSAISDIQMSKKIQYFKLKASNDQI